MNSPPRPPPHGEVPKGSGLPPGKYDIFIIPPHSAGSGFLYLPSLQPNVNSFAAGFASALVLVALFQIVTPAIRSWWYTIQSNAGLGMFMAVAAIAVWAWAMGRQQNDGPGPGGTGGGTTNTPGGSSWQRTNPTFGGSGANTAKGQWEKAREETRKKEEERKTKEAERKKKEDLEKKVKEAREKEAREREARERRDTEFRNKGSTYAFSSTGEKTNPWPRPPPPPPAPGQSSTKKPPPPTAKTYRGTEDDEYSYRPYDKPTHKKSHSSLYSESSYAASHSTSKTSPPPSNRQPYKTKDPDKIVIKAVYAFNNTFKTPTSQLVSGSGSVTDGLILRVTTEGLFIDDDVRGVPQREWDVKAWTMKQVEVWCPTFSFRQRPTGSSPQPKTAFNPVRQLWNLEKTAAASSEDGDKFLATLLTGCKDKCRLNHDPSAAAFAAAAAFSASASTSASASSILKERSSNTPRAGQQTGEVKSSGLHVLRASIRDTEGKRYLFVITQDEAWKVALGLQRLRKGTQVRSLVVTGMSASDAKATLEGLGWK